jgi:murein DD-endopeptidase MepM/ murein hydrolase activator NlpD
VSQQARAIQPGEVVRLVVTPTQPVTSLHGRLGDVRVPFWRSGSGAAWEGLVGIDVETAPGERRLALHAAAPDGTTVVVEHVLQVAPKTFRERQLKVDPRFSDPPPAMLPRIRAEAKRLEALFDDASCAGPPAIRFAAPSADPQSSPFGSRSIYNGKPRSRHNGVDFGSPRGAPVIAPADGRVALVDDLYFTGLTVVVDHGCGIYSLLAHLDETAVSAGADVRQGARLGAVGSTGRSTGPHLHWSVRLHGTRVDPTALIALSRMAPTEGRSGSEHPPYRHARPDDRDPVVGVVGVLAEVEPQLRND